MSHPKLTPKQQAFVNEYLIDLNAAAAARRAGYSEKTARKIGQENLTKPDIAAAIEKAQAARAERTQITADRVAEELAKVGFANLMDYFELTSDGEPFIDLSSVTRDQAAALSEITVDDYFDGRGEDAREVRRVRIKVADKLRALEQLGRHLGMFTDRTELSGPGGAPLAAGVVHFYLPGNNRDEIQEGEDE